MHHTTNAILVASILAIDGFLCGPMPLFAVAGGVPDTPEVVLLRTPAEGIQPQAVSDQNGLVHLVYFRGEPAAGDLYYTEIGAGKKDFNPSVRVNSQPGSTIAIETVRSAHLTMGAEEGFTLRGTDRPRRVRRTCSARTPCSTPGST